MQFLTSFGENIQTKTEKWWVCLVQIYCGLSYFLINALATIKSVGVVILIFSLFPSTR